MIEPTQIIEESDSQLTIAWSDGVESLFDAVALRKSCPCAGCVNEWTGEKILNDTMVPDDLTISHTTIVGRYALNFHFSDGHHVGIFSFKFLRNLADEGRSTVS